MFAKVKFNDLEAINRQLVTGVNNVLMIQLAKENKKNITLIFFKN